MKKVCIAILSILLSSVLLSTALAAEESRAELRVGVDVPYPPFAMADEQGHLYGFDVDLIRAICDEMQYKCTLQPIPFDELIPSIVEGKIDIAIAGMGATDERKKLVDFSDRYFRSLSIFVERAGEFDKVSIQALKGKRLCTQAGTMQEGYLQQEFGGLVEIVTVPTFEGALSLVSEGKADLALVDGLAAYNFLKSEAGVGLEVIGDPVPSEKVLDTGSIAVSKKLPEVREAINKAIEALRRNGEYARINRKYFDFTVF